MNTLVLKPSIDNRSVRAGYVHASVLRLTQQTSIRLMTSLQLWARPIRRPPVHCVLVDEAQFLSAEQVGQLSEVVDRLDIPVLAYGLRTDFLGQLFDGSRQLLALADELREIKTVCHAGARRPWSCALIQKANPSVRAIEFRLAVMRPMSRCVDVTLKRVSGKLSVTRSLALGLQSEISPSCRAARAR